MITVHCARCKSDDLIIDPSGGYWCRGCFKFLQLYKTIMIFRGDKEKFCPECDGFGAVGMEGTSFDRMNIDDRLRSVITKCEKCAGTGVINEQSS